jgi:hypothetical protein
MEPKQALVRVIIDKWLVPVLVEQFLASAAVARAPSAEGSHPKLSGLPAR